MMLLLLLKVLSKIDKCIVKFENSQLKKFFASNEGLIIHPHIIKGAKYISIGKGTTLDRGVILTAWDKYGNQNFTPKISIGMNCHIGEHCQISACNNISIGDNLLTGRYVYISDNSHGNSVLEESIIPPIKRLLHSKGNVVIGDNVWIGEHVCILSGVNIGNGCVIGANAVVTRSFPDNCVLGGTSKNN